MKKNTLFLSLLFFIVLNSFSQRNKTCGKIEYKFITNIAYEYIENYSLTFNNKESFCEEINIKKSKTDKSLENKPKGAQVNIVDGRKNITSKYYYNSRSFFHFRDNFFDELLLVKEKPLKNQWKLHSETKKLSNFLCKKATIQFRGRKYTAWYTTKIPVPFGPWKLRGLPGMILEFYDTEKYFHVIATLIKVGKDDCSFNAPKKDFEKAMTLPSYLNKKEKIITEMFAKMSAKRPKGSKPLKMNKNCEDCLKQIEIFDEKK